MSDCTIADSANGCETFELSCRYNPKPDGNCQFASLSDQLKYKLNVDISHEGLRHAVVKHLHNHETAKNFVAGSWSSYLRKMDQLGTYGDHVTLTAVAALYQVQIFVLSSTKCTTFLSFKDDTEFDPTVCCLFVGYFPEDQGEHYVGFNHPTDLLNFCTSKLATRRTTPFVSDTALGIPVSTEVKSSEGSGTIPSNDFGLYMDVPKLSDKQKLAALQNHWCPTQPSDYPFSIHTKQGIQRRRSLNQGHLQRYQWLAVSKCDGKAGAWCAVCVLFAVSSEYMGKRMGKLVNRPLIDFSDLTGKKGALDVHEQSGFHAANAARAAEFIARAADPTTHVDVQVNSLKREEVLRNRQALASIVDTVMFAAIQNIPFRGHRDDGRIEADGSYPAENDGNFRMLLRFRVNSGDTMLQSHLRHANANAMYTSKTTQNDLLKISANMVREKILSRVSASPCWAFMADETTDRANREQLVMVVRYVDKCEGSYVVREDPIQILDLISDIRQVLVASADDDDDDTTEMRMSGENIASVIIKKLRSMPLHPNTMVAQCYDGAACMSSDRVGATAHVKVFAPNAEYFHCANHGLNLATSQVTSVDVVRNAQSTMESIIVFITDSAKREDLLRHTVKKNFDQNVKHKLVKLCQTRFVERHVAVERFWEQLPAIATALRIMSSWKDRRASSKATMQLNSLLTTDFIVGIHTMKCLAAHLRPLSLSLQEKVLDLTTAISKISAVSSVLQEMRKEAVAEFSAMFAEMTNMASQLGFEISIPRVTAVSRYRANAATEQDAEIYYRVNVFIPALDAVILDINDRFSSQQQSAFALSYLLPSLAVTVTWDSLKQAFCKYRDVLVSKFPEMSENQAEAEFKVWSAMCRAKSTVAESAIAAVNDCPADALPIIHTMLTILATLPVCTAEAERTFSKVERTLTALRSTMTEDRLDALILLQAHRDLLPDTQSIVDEYVMSGPDGRRRLDLKVN